MVTTGVLFRNSKLFMYVLAAIAMSGYDAVATMQHIGRGVAAEGNPLMASLIHQNAIVFFLVKMASDRLRLADLLPLLAPANRAARNKAGRRDLPVSERLPRNDCVAGVSHRRRSPVAQTARKSRR